MHPLRAPNPVTADKNYRNPVPRVTGEGAPLLTIISKLPEDIW